MRRETAAVNALLPLVMRHGCRELPDMTALNKRLERLYGARIDGYVTKYGDVQVVTMFCENLADKYALENEPILSQCADLLRSVIFDPALENGCFKPTDVEIEKRNLIDQIDSIVNDKRQYAGMRLREEMCKDEAYGVSEYGKREDVDGITPQILYDAWQAMLKTAPVEIFVIGPGDSEPVEKLFSGAFGAVDRSNVVSPATVVKKDVGEVKTVIDRMPVTQAKLIMGFRAGTAAPENTDAVNLACVIWGGSPNAKLFANVREKMSLCYYCWSYIELKKGIIFVDSGIEEDNYDKARSEILHQLDELKKGNFTDDELRFAKLYLQNSLTQVSDSVYSLFAYYLIQAVAGKIRTPQQAVDAMKGVTREEIIKAANGIKLDTVYMLAGIKEDGSSND